MPSPVILPGATLGVLGSGQLGRMFAQAAQTMGYRVITYAPDATPDSPAGQVAWRCQADYADTEALRDFARQVDVVTVEFENIPAEALQTLALHVPVRPSPDVLHTTQHRLREKAFLSAHDIPVAPFVRIHSLSDLAQALETLGTPAILKSGGFGYDGKGQFKITDKAQCEEAWQTVCGAIPSNEKAEAVLEEMIPFVAECSVLIASNANGETAVYDVIENRHTNHILDVSYLPAPSLSSATQAQAQVIARQIAMALKLEGILCVECFVLADGSVLVNEVAPRPHNSGHLTIEGCVTSQFEQQVRAICNLPLGSTTCLGRSAMVNLMGEHLERQAPSWQSILDNPWAKLHLYGKVQACSGRKMGHISACYPITAEEWPDQTLLALRDSIR